jgi:hypothetical protein
MHLNQNVLFNQYISTVKYLNSFLIYCKQLLMYSFDELGLYYTVSFKAVNEI